MSYGSSIVLSKKETISYFGCTNIIFVDVTMRKKREIEQDRNKMLEEIN